MYYTIIIILPFIITIGLIIWKEEPISPILLGLFLSLWIQSRFNPVKGFFSITGNVLLKTLTTPYVWYILVLILSILILYYLLNTRNVFYNATNSAILKKISRYNLELITFGFGIILAFEEIASVAMSSIFIKPFAKKKNLNNRRFTVIVSSLSPSLFTLIPFSLFLSTILPIVGNTLSGIGIVYPPLKIFLKSIPFQFYNIFTISMLAITAILKRDIKIFRNNQNKIESKALIIAQNHRSIKNKDIPINHSIYAGGVSIAIAIIGFISIAVLKLSRPGLTGRINPRTIEGLFTSAVIGSIVYFILYSIITKRDTTASITLRKESLNTLSLVVIIYLVLSISIVTVIKEIELSKHITKLFIDKKTDLRFFPVIFFIVSSIIAFISGSRLLTISTILPLAIKGLSIAHSDPLIIDYFTFATVGAVISGSTLGTINSIFSPIFIITTAAGELSIKTKFLTQLPYMLLPFILSIIFGYLPSYLEINPVLSIIAGILIIGVILSFISKITKKY